LGRTLTTTALSNLALPLSALVTGPILARTLGPDGRGELAAVLAPVGLAAMLLTFGLPESLAFHVARGRMRVRDAVRLGVALGALTGLIAAAVVVLLAPLILRRHPEGEGLLIALAATLPLLMAVGTLRYVAQGSDRFDLVNRERWLAVGSRLVLIVALAAAGAVTVTNAAWVTQGTTLLATAMLLPIALRRVESRPARYRPPQQAERPIAAAGGTTARILLGYGLRGWTATLGAIVVLRLDQVLIAPFAGTRELGYYAVAVSVAELPAIALLAAREVMLATSAGRSDPLLIARMTRTIIVVAIPVCLLGILVAPVALPLLFGSAFEPAVAMAQILLLAAVPGGVGFILAAALLGLERPRLASASQAVGAVVLIVGLAMFVPSGGAMAAAWVGLVARLTAMGLATASLVRVTGIGWMEFLVPRRDDVRELVRRLRAQIVRDRPQPPR
jgi:O-antigen/teichoic acid export membrane protein